MYILNEIRGKKLQAIVCEQVRKNNVVPFGILLVSRWLLLVSRWYPVGIPVAPFGTPMVPFGCRNSLLCPKRLGQGRKQKNPAVRQGFYIWFCSCLPAIAF